MAQKLIKSLLLSRNRNDVIIYVELITSWLHNRFSHKTTIILQKYFYYQVLWLYVKTKLLLMIDCYRHYIYDSIIQSSIDIFINQHHLWYVDSNIINKNYFLTTCNMQMRNYICLKIPRWLIIFVLYMDYHFKSVTMQKHNPI